MASSPIWIEVRIWTHQPGDPPVQMRFRGQLRDLKMSRDAIGKDKFTGKAWIPAPSSEIELNMVSENWVMNRGAPKGWRE